MGNKGTEEKRTIDVSINSNDNETFEGIENIDINQDGDNYDFFNANLTTYTASEGLGSFSILTNSSSVTYNVDILPYLQIQLVALKPELTPNSALFNFSAFRLPNFIPPQFQYFSSCISKIP